MVSYSFGIREGELIFFFEGRYVSGTMLGDLLTSADYDLICLDWSLGSFKSVSGDSTV